MNTHGEYLVNRWKAQIFSTVPLYAVEGGYSIALLQYPEPLGPMLDRAGDTIVDIVTAAASRAVPLGESWGRLLTCVYRNVFEPLARESAYREGNAAVEETPGKAPGVEQSQFYERHVAPYWVSWHKELQRSFETFDTDPSETIAVLAATRETLEEFLAHVGVTCGPLESKDIYVHFDGDVALAMR